MVKFYLSLSATFGAMLILVFSKSDVFAGHPYALAFGVSLVINVIAFLGYTAGKHSGLED